MPCWRRSAPRRISCAPPRTSSPTVRPDPRPDPRPPGRRNSSAFNDLTAIGAAMTAIMQTLLFMLAVLAAVAVLARRLNLAPSILLVIAGIVMAVLPGLPRVSVGAGSGAARHPAAADLFRRRRHELARVQGQPKAHRPARLRLRGVHGQRRGGRRALPAAFPVAGRLRARRHHRAARRGGAARHRAPARHAAPDRGGAGRRRPRQRRHRAHPLPLRRRRCGHRRLLTRKGGRHLRRRS